MAMMPVTASALPLFNRQTGQNCVACHAGGQFPELTPYGRMFKMTGYTIGERALPIARTISRKYKHSDVIMDASAATNSAPTIPPSVFAA